MLKVTLILDNKFASPLSPKEFVREYYLTRKALEDLKNIFVEQKSHFVESIIENEERNEK